MRILIVGDDFLSREMMHQLFVRNGDSPVSVESGKEALAMMSRNRFDVLLTDINLPDMSGFELYETLHLSAKPGQPVPHWLVWFPFRKTECYEKLFPCKYPSGLFFAGNR